MLCMVLTFELLIFSQERESKWVEEKRGETKNLKELVDHFFQAPAGHRRPGVPAVVRRRRRPRAGRRRRGAAHGWDRLRVRQPLPCLVQSRLLLARGRGAAAGGRLAGGQDEDCRPQVQEDRNQLPEAGSPRLEEALDQNNLNYNRALTVPREGSRRPSQAGRLPEGHLLLQPHDGDEAGGVDRAAAHPRRGQDLLSPPTKEGKNNGYRQTNARTVYIIKYTNFFDGSVKKKAKRRIRF